MPDPFLLIVGVIALLCVVLFPLRLWQRRRHRYGDASDASDGASGEDPPAPRG